MDWREQGSDASRLYDGYLGPAIFQPWAERLVEVVGPVRRERWLDVGCGTGRVALAAVASAPEVEVVGVDVSAAQLEVARERDELGRVRWTEGGAEALPFGDESFTVLTCQQALQFVENREAAVGEMHRVLRPGGRIAVAAWTSIDEQPVHLALWRVMHRHLGERAARMRLPFSLSEGSELGRLLAGAGFAAVDVWQETREVRFIPGHRLASSLLLSGPSGPAFLRLPEETQQAILAEARAAFPPGREDAVTTTMTSNVATARRTGAGAVL